jgi:bifunctional glutamyl/prolyl-tRNA synthetase
MSGAELKAKIEEQGNKVRLLKESKAAKGEIDGAVKALLDLKAQYKEATGEDYAPPGGNQRSGGGKKDAKKENKPPQAQQAPKDSGAGAAGDTSGKKQTKLGIDCKKSENLSDWFSQVRL